MNSSTPNLKSFPSGMLYHLSAWQTCILIHLVYSVFSLPSSSASGCLRSPVIILLLNLCAQVAWATFLENEGWDWNKMQKDRVAWPQRETNLTRRLKEMKRRQSVPLEQPLFFSKTLENLVKSLLFEIIFWP